MTDRYGVDYFANLPAADRHAPSTNTKLQWRTIVDKHGIHDYELGTNHDDVIRMRKLWRAALDQAVEDLCHSPPLGEAVEWFKGHIVHGTASSDFTNTCDFADLDPAWVRRTINKIIAVRKGTNG